MLILLSKKKTFSKPLWFHDCIRIDFIYHEKRFYHTKAKTVKIVSDHKVKRSNSNGVFERPTCLHSDQNTAISTNIFYHKLFM